ncbi:hypothetical protein [Spiroplasma endosymbiont of Panorpa germanica]|uniref:hypothetical protein n=1 Tax=Spiroplasma endosymbiont of Panorpa germanica TaxID=3066314 RepID=UPI0030D54DC9
MNIGCLRGYIDSGSFKEYGEFLYFNLIVDCHGIDSDSKISSVSVRMKKNLASKILEDKDKYCTEKNPLVIIGYIQIFKAHGMFAQEYALLSELNEKKLSISEYILSKIWRNL